MALEGAGGDGIAPAPPPEEALRIEGREHVEVLRAVELANGDRQLEVGTRREHRPRQVAQRLALGAPARDLRALAGGLDVEAVDAAEGLQVLQVVLLAAGEVLADGLLVVPVEPAAADE